MPGEYKPRRMGDSAASTTPVRGDAPIVSEVDYNTPGNMFPIYRHLAQYGGLQSTAASVGVLTQNYIVFAPLVDLYTKIYAKYVSLYLTTADAAGTFKGAIYNYKRGNFTKVKGSEFSFGLATTGRLVTDVNFSLTQGERYFWASWTDSAVTAKFTVFNLASPDGVPQYQYERTSLADLPNIVPDLGNSATTAKNYGDGAYCAVPLVTYLSADMRDYI